MPLRTLLALLACSFAWLTLFNTTAEIRRLQHDATQSAWLAGAPGWQLSLPKVYQEDGTYHVRTLPRQQIEQVQALSRAVVMQLSLAAHVISPDRQSRIPLKVLLYDDTLGPPAQRGVFPACSLIRPSPELAGQHGLLLLASGWRCQVMPLPPPLVVLLNRVDGSAIAFPLSAQNELIGRRAQDAVEVLWVGLPDASQLNPLQHRSKAGLEIRPLAGQLGAQTRVLAGSTQLWLAAAVGMMLVGVGLYVQGVFAAMKQELGLRACIGLPSGHIFIWLLVDLMAQALLLMAMACGAGIMVHAVLHGTFPLHDNGQLIFNIGVLLSMMAMITSAAITWRLRRHPNLILMLRGN